MSVILGYGGDVRADRLVSLALLLQARGRMSACDLAAELEVSVRTIYRDISALNAAGIPVLAEPGRSGGCRLIDGYRFPLRGLSAEEAEALLILGVPTAITELGFADALAAAHRKVRTTAGGAGRAAGERGDPEPVLVHLDMPRWFHAVEPTPYLRAVAEAVRQRRRVLLGYQRDEDGPDKTREVGPLGLVNKAGTWYLVASAAGLPGGRAGVHAGGAAGEPGDGEPLVYRVGRISGVRVLAATFARPSGFDLAGFWDRWSASFQASRPRIEVSVRLSPAALAAFPVVFGDPGRQVTHMAGPPDYRGFREAVMSFEDERAAAQRLAGFGGAVEVLTPPGVRERLIATARDLLARYERPGFPALHTSGTDKLG